MDGSFTSMDALRLKKYARKDSFWSYIKRQIKISYILINKKLFVCEIGGGNGDIAALSDLFLSDCIEKFICTDSCKEMLDLVEEKGIIKKRILNAEKDSLPKAD